MSIGSGCPVCQGALRPFLRRPAVPVHQNLLFADADAARAMLRGELDLRWCEGCGYVTNASFDEALLSYGARYENTQTLSPSFSEYVDDLLGMLTTAGVKGKHVVEVGCGKGSFLRSLCARGENSGLGFDPSYVGPASESGGRVRYLRQLFEPGLVERPVDAVVCRHVIEHVGSPVGLMASVRQVVRDDGLVFFETPALEWILGGVVFWDLFYEHCGYFTRVALGNLFQTAGFEVLEIGTVFGGQYLVVTARPVASSPPPSPVPAVFCEELNAYNRLEGARLRHWRERIDDLAGRGRLAVWGAGAKGVTFVNLLDPEASRIACVVDINPAKQRHYVPGTGHPVVAPADLRAGQVRQVILMNPNYLQETQRLATELGLELEIITAS
jgi:SAM-dependent methyltransferase